MDLLRRFSIVCGVAILLDAARAVQILPQKVINLNWDLSSGHRIVDNLVDKVWANSYVAESLDVGLLSPEMLRYLADARSRA